MNCSDVMPLLDQLVKPSIDDSPDQAAMREHVAGCRSCQQSLRSLTIWDRQLTRAMKEVAVPAGLSSRLIDALNAANQPVSADLGRKTHGRSLFLRIIGSITAACLICLAVFGTREYLRLPTLSVNDVALLLQQSAEALPVDEEAFQQLPYQWNSLRGRLYMDSGRRLERTDLKLSVAMIPLAIKASRNSYANGSLLVVPKSRWASTPAAAASEAVVQYSGSQAWIAWSEGDVVYVLAVNEQVPLLESLQRQLGGNQSFL